MSKWGDEVQRALEKRGIMGKIAVPGEYETPENYKRPVPYRCKCGRMWSLYMDYTYLDTHEPTWEDTAMIWPMGCSEHGVSESKRVDGDTATP